MALEALESLQAALEANDHGAVVEQTPEVLAAFATERQRETAIDTLAGEVRGTPTGDALEESATEYFIAATTADQARMAVSASLKRYLEQGPDAADTKDLVDTALETQHRVEESITSLQSAVDEAAISLPPLAVLTGPSELTFPKGLSQSAELTLENVGGAPLEDATIRVDTEFDVSVSPANVDTLGVDSEQPITLSGGPTTTGVYTIEVAVTVDGDPVDDISITAAVASAKQFLQAAVTDITEIKDTVSEFADTNKKSNNNNGTDDDNGKGNGKDGNNESANGNPGSGLQGLLAKLDQAKRSLQKAITWIEQGRKEQPIDQKVGAAINQLGAFIKQAEALSGKTLSARESALVQENASEIMGDLETAIDIDI